MGNALWVHNMGRRSCWDPDEVNLGTPVDRQDGVDIYEIDVDGETVRVYVSGEDGRIYDYDSHPPTPRNQLDILVSNGTRRSSEDVNQNHVNDGRRPPYTSGTTVTEFVSDGSTTFARVVTGNSPCLLYTSPSPRDRG